MASKYLLDKHQNILFGDACIRHERMLRDEQDKINEAKLNVVKCTKDYNYNVSEAGRLGKSVERNRKKILENLLLVPVTIVMIIFLCFVWEPLAMFAGVFCPLYIIYHKVTGGSFSLKMLLRDKNAYDRAYASMDANMSKLVTAIKEWYQCAKDVRPIPEQYDKIFAAAEEQYQKEANDYKSAVKKAIPIFRQQLSLDAVKWMKSDFKNWYIRNYNKQPADIFSVNCWSLRVEQAHVESCTGETMVFGVYGMQPLKELSDRSAMAYVLGRTMKELIAEKFQNLTVTMEYSDNEVFIYL